MSSAEWNENPNFQKFKDYLLELLVKDEKQMRYSYLVNCFSLNKLLNDFPWLLIIWSLKSNSVWINGYANVVHMNII